MDLDTSPFARVDRERLRRAFANLYLAASALEDMHVDTFPLVEQTVMTMLQEAFTDLAALPEPLASSLQLSVSATERLLDRVGLPGVDGFRTLSLAAGRLQAIAGLVRDAMRWAEQARKRGAE